MIASNGGIAGCGGATTGLGTPGTTLNAPVVGMAVVPG